MDKFLPTSVLSFPMCETEGEEPGLEDYSGSHPGGSGHLLTLNQLRQKQQLEEAELSPYSTVEFRDSSIETAQTPEQASKFPRQPFQAETTAPAEPGRK